MPTRSFYFPPDFSHIEAILSSEDPNLTLASFSKFREKKVAPLFAPLDIATVLGIGPGLIISMMRRPQRHYRSFSMKKSDGSERLISAPRTYLKTVQWWILENILGAIEYADCVFGFRKGKSIRDNALYHSKSTHILNVDIESFFSTISDKQVHAIFLDLGYGHSTASALTRLCTLNGSLPQGAPTSPSLSNYVMKPVDLMLCDLAQRFGLQYSRYADDMTFSSASVIPYEIVDQIKSVVGSAGFSLKSTKTRFKGLGGRREVTGIVAGDIVQPPVQWRKKQRSRLHHLQYKGNLDRKDVAYLLGLRGYALQFSDAVQMRALADGAGKLLGRSPKPAPDFDTGAPDLFVRGH